VRFLGTVRFFRDGEHRIGGIRSVLADYPGYYAVFMVRDLATKEEFVVDSRSTY
jgi:hypothetical protein